MVAPRASDLANAFRISEVWTALGGPPQRNRRGQAWWRNGTGYNVSLSDARNAWFDFVAGQGGGVLDLIQTVLGCSRADAFRWLADFAGVQLDPAKARGAYIRTRDKERAAQRWAFTVKLLSEELLEELSSTSALRASLTHLSIIGSGGEPKELLDEFSAWQAAAPELTRAMVRAGWSAERRRERLLRAFIEELADAP